MQISGAFVHLIGVVVTCGAFLFFFFILGVFSFSASIFAL